MKNLTNQINRIVHANRTVTEGFEKNIYRRVRKNLYKILRCFELKSQILTIQNDNNHTDLPNLSSNQRIAPSKDSC